MDFLVNSSLHSVSVDITKDQMKMMRTWDIEIPEDCYIDLQDLIHFDEQDGKTVMAHMSTAYIHEDYARMKEKFPKKNHNFLEKNPPDWINLEYAAIDAYVAFELFRVYSSELE